LEPPRDKSPSRATSPGRPISPGPPLLGRYQPVEPRLLGAGRYGPVLRVRDLETNTVVALKVFNAAETWRRHSEPGGRATGVLAGCLSLRDAEAEVLRAFRAEVRWLRRAHESSSGLSSTAVAGLLHYSQDAFGEPTTALDGLCYLVLELGMFTFDQLVRDGRNVARQPSITEVRETVRLLFSSLAALHADGFVLALHSPKHWMRFPRGWKLIAAEALRPAGKLELTEAKEPLYRAPEYATVARGTHYTHALELTSAMDVWSMALLSLEMLLPAPLFSSPFDNLAAARPADAAQAYYRWLAAQTGPVELPADLATLSPQLVHLMSQLLQRDPTKRWTAAQALEHPFFATGPRTVESPPLATALAATPTMAPKHPFFATGAAAADAATPRVTLPPTQPATPLAATTADMPTGSGGGVHDGQYGSGAQHGAQPFERSVATPTQRSPPQRSPPQRATGAQPSAVPSAVGAFGSAFGGDVGGDVGGHSASGRGRGSPLAATPTMARPYEIQAAAAIRARDLALAELHTSTLQLGAVRQQLQQLQQPQPPSPDPSPAPPAPPAPQEEVERLKRELQAAQAAQEEVERLNRDLRTLLRDVGAADIERQQLSTTLVEERRRRERAEEEARRALAKCDDVSGRLRADTDVEKLHLLDIQKTNEVLEAARVRMEAVTAELASEKRRAAELESKFSLDRLGSVNVNALEMQLSAAIAAKEVAERHLERALATAHEQQAQLVNAESALRAARAEILSSDRLRREAEARALAAAAAAGTPAALALAAADALAAHDGGSSASTAALIAKTHQEADERVREVRRRHDEALRDERRRAADDMQRAERAAKKVQPELP
jgi:serine/threonine protein kinase